jgi:hypothetical protein
MVGCLGLDETLNCQCHHLLRRAFETVYELLNLRSLEF